MDRAKIIAKLRAYKRNPEVYKELSASELADLVVVVLSQVDLIEKAIREGRLDGYTPQPDKDYLAKGTALKYLTNAVNNAIGQASADFDARMAQRGSALERQVQAAIERIRDGKDGIVSEEEIARAAEIAASLIELPDFDTLIGNEIPRHGEAIRNALELLQGKDRLSVEAVDGLAERLEEVARYAQSVGSGTIGKQQVYGFIRQAVADGTIPQTDSLPDQTGNAGKFLTTDGTDASWATVAGGGHVIEDEGTPLTQRTKLNFVGAGVTVTDDAGDDATVVSITAGGISDGDKGDITVSGVGNTWTIDNNAVTTSKINEAAVQASKLATGDTHNIVKNGVFSFDQSTGTTDGWNATPIAIATTDPSVPAGAPSAFAGTVSVLSVVRDFNANNGVGTPCSPGEIYHYEYWAASTADANQNMNFRVAYLNPASTLAFTSVIVSTTPGTTWAKYSGTFTVPATVGAITLPGTFWLQWRVPGQSASPAGSWFLTQIKLYRVNTIIPQSSVTNLTSDLAAKAPLAAPTFTGTTATDLFTYDAARGKVTAGGNLGATETINFNDETNYTGTLDSNITFTFANATSGDEVTLFLSYDGTAQRTITWPTVTWLDNATGAAPATPAASGNVLVVTVRYIGTTFYASATGNYTVYS